MIENLIVLATFSITLLAAVSFVHYFHHAAIRAAKRAADEYRPSIGSVCGEDGGYRQLPDVRGGRIDQSTGKLERP